jgi:hypothetical protein
LGSAAIFVGKCGEREQGALLVYRLNWDEVQYVGFSVGLIEVIFRREKERGNTDVKVVLK